IVGSRASAGIKMGKSDDWPTDGLVWPATPENLHKGAIILGPNIVEKAHPERLPSITKLD
ncbi:unnamed protein product, partial [marine sediment metagenome]